MPWRWSISCWKTWARNPDAPRVKRTPCSSWARTVAFSARGTVPHLPRIERQPSCFSFFVRETFTSSGFKYTWSGTGGASSFFSGSSGELRESRASALPETMKSLTASPTCGAAKATPNSSLIKSVFISLMRLLMRALLMSATGISKAPCRSTGLSFSGTIVRIPETITESVQCGHAPHQYAHQTSADHGPGNRAGRTHGIFLQRAQQDARARWPRSNQHGAHGETAASDTDERPLLPQKGLRRCGQFLEKILVRIKSGEVQQRQ